MDPNLAHRTLQGKNSSKKSAILSTYMNCGKFFKKTQIEFMWPLEPRNSWFQENIGSWTSFALRRSSRNSGNLVCPSPASIICPYEHFCRSKTMWIEAWSSTIRRKFTHYTRLGSLEALPSHQGSEIDRIQVSASFNQIPKNIPLSIPFIILVQKSQFEIPRPAPTSRISSKCAESVIKIATPRDIPWHL